MRFNTEEDAWNHWLGLYEFHGKYEGIGRNLEDQMEMFAEWAEDNNVTWLDEDLASWLSSMDEKNFSDDSL